jgi:hypothetical protein
MARAFISVSTEVALEGDESGTGPGELVFGFNSSLSFVTLDDDSESILSRPPDSDS